MTSREVTYMPTLTEGGNDARTRVVTILGSMAMSIPSDVLDAFDWDGAAMRTGEDALSTNAVALEAVSRDAWLRDIEHRTASAMVPSRYSSTPLDVSHDDALSNGRGMYISGVMGSTCPR